jgi:SLT domain-containing protein
VYVVSGGVKNGLAQALSAAFRAGTAPAPAHFPAPLPEVFAARVADFGERYYSSLAIARDDALRRARQTERNFS